MATNVETNLMKGIRPDVKHGTVVKLKKVPALKEKILPNETAAEAFLYEYTNLVNGKIYCGVHKGRVDDKYHHSSTNEEFMDDMLTDDFMRSVSLYGTYREMLAAEHRILSSVNAKDNPMWYNKTNGAPILDISDQADIEKMLDIADQINETGSLADIDIIEVKFDKKNWDNDPLAKVVFFQIRELQLDKEHSLKIRDKIDDALGVLSRVGMTLIVVILVNRNGKDRGIGGNHTWDGIIKSKHGRTMPILYIPEELHKDWSDSEIKVLASFLNKRPAQITLTSSNEDIGNLVYAYRKANPGIEDNRNSDITKIYKGHSLAKRDIAWINDYVNTKIREDALANTNWINYATGPWKKVLDKEVASWTIQDETYCKAHSSGRPSIGDDLILLLNDLKDIKHYVCILHHPSPSLKRNYDKKYRVLNQTALDNFEEMSGIRCELIEKQTIAPQLFDE